MQVSEHFVSFYPLTVNLPLLGGSTDVDRYRTENLKPKDVPYKLTDRDGMYVTVSTANAVKFRYDYRINGKRETLTIGRYGPGGLSLARAREKCIDAKRGRFGRPVPGAD